MFCARVGNFYLPVFGNSSSIPQRRQLLSFSDDFLFNQINFFFLKFYVNFAESVRAIDALEENLESILLQVEVVELVILYVNLISNKFH